jgi:carboxymethylenebutenolidase
VPKKPVILHFGKADLHIPVADVEKVAAERPELPIYLYDADHGFNCDQRASYDKAAADLALSRSLSFFKEHLGS